MSNNDLEVGIYNLEDEPPIDQQTYYIISEKPEEEEQTQSSQQKIQMSYTSNSIQKEQLFNSETKYQNSVSSLTY